MHKHRPLFIFAAIPLLVSLACQLPAMPGLEALPFRPAPAATATAPASGSLLFEDNFSDRTSGWDRQGANEGLMDYYSGGFRMLVNSSQANFWSTPHKDVADVRVEVDEGKLGGPDENRVGLICRYSGSSFYFFMITHDGYYGIGLFSGDQASGGQMELIGQEEMQTSPVINRGTNVNHLRADCIGDTLSLYVNGEQVAQVQDARLSHGDVGLLAGTFSQPGADIIFDNFVLIQP
jgi:hypothetical protein